MSGSKIKQSGRHGHGLAAHAQAGGRHLGDHPREAGWLAELTAGPARAPLRPAAAGTAAPEIADAAIADAAIAETDELAGDGALPAASRVLAVVARPGQESSDLGAVLAAFRLHGAELAVLCLTRGEASEVNSTCERLESLRPWELRMAAGLLGVSSVTVADYPDGRLGYLPPTGLAEHITRSVRRTGADLLLVVDPAAVADLDTAAVARAAALAAREGGLPLLARTVSGPGQRWRVDLGGAEADVRARQRRALGAHRSQLAGSRAEGPGIGVDAGGPGIGVDAGGPGVGAGAGGPGAAGGDELIRWLVAPQAPAPAPAPAAASPA